MIRLVAPQKRKSRKNAYFRSQICIFASDNSERSLVIQNNVPQSTPLISKSLPIYPARIGNSLFLNKIVRKRKIPTELFKRKLTLYFINKETTKQLSAFQVGLIIL